MLRSRAARWLVPFGTVFLVLAVVLGILWLSRIDEGLPTGDSIASIVSALAALSSLTSSFIFEARARRRDQAVPDEDAALDRAARTLARRVRRQWELEVGKRRLRHPRPLRLRWKRTARAAGPRSALPATAALLVDRGTREPAAGLVDAFRTLPVPQLVILGAPGAGKSTLAMLFTLAALPAAVEDGPVPVLLQVPTWDPGDDLKEWAATAIAATYPEVAGAARALVEHDRVLLVLDGLDELPAPIRAQAARRLGDAAAVGGLPMVITCRRAEYDEIVAGEGRLPLAAEVTIAPVTARDAIAFLRAGESSGGRWDPVVAAIRADPKGPLATALSTPLMISLARTVYRPAGTDPGTLTTFGTAAAVEDHLLDRFVPAVFDDPDAERYLRTLARHLRHRLHHPNLAWWELARAVPPPLIVAVPALMMGVLTAFFGLLAGVLAGSLELLSDWLLPAFGYGLPLGMVAGLQAARAGHGRRQARDGRFRRLAARVITVGRDVALSVVFIAVPIVGVHAVWVGPTIGWREAAFGDWSLEVLGVTLTLAATQSVVGSGLHLVRGALPVRTRWRLSRLPRRLIGGLVSGAGVGIPIGAVTGLLSGVTGGNEVEDPASGVVWGLVTAGVPTGLSVATLVTVLVGVPVGVGRWLTRPVDEETTVSPRAVFRSDALTSLIMAVAGGTLACAVVGAGLLTKGFPPIDTGRAVILGLFLTVLMASLAIGGGAPWVAYTIARCWLAIWRRLPWHTLRFLEAAHEREILRQVGAVYQFRHDRVESHLATAEKVAVRRWPVETRERAAGPGPSGSRPRWRRAAEAVATVIVLVGGGLFLVPGLREDLTRFSDALRDRQAGVLWSRADELDARDPRAALHLRIAAAELGDDDVSRLELAAFLRAAVSGGNGRIVRLHNAVTVDPWLLTLDRNGLLQAWDSRTAEPAPIELGHTVSMLLEAEGGAVANEPGRSVFWDLTGRQPRAVDLPIAEVRQVTGPVDGLMALGNGTSSTVADLRSGGSRAADRGTHSGRVTPLPGAAWLVVEENIRTGQGSFVVDLATGRRSRIAPPGQVMVDVGLFGTTLRVPAGRRKDNLWDLSVWPPRRLPFDLDLTDRLTADGRWLLRDDRLLYRVGPTTTPPYPISGSYGRIAFTSNGDLFTADLGDDLVHWDLRQPAPRRSLVAAALESPFFVQAAAGGTNLIPAADTVVGIERDAQGVGEAVHYDLRTDPPTRRVLVDSAQEVELTGSTAMIQRDDLSLSIWDVSGRPRRISDVAVAPDLSYLYPPPAGNENWIWGGDPAGEYLWAVGSPRTVLLTAGPDSGTEIRKVNGSSWAARLAPSSSTMWHRGPDGAITTYDLGGLTNDVFAAVNGRWAILLHLDQISPVRSHDVRELMAIWRLDTPMPPEVTDPFATACARLSRPLTPGEWAETMPGIPYRTVCAGRR